MGAAPDEAHQINLRLVPTVGGSLPNQLGLDRIASPALHVLLDSHIPAINALAWQRPVFDVFSHAEQ